MNIHKFDIITYEEKWPKNKPKNIVSRIHELTINSNNKNKWVDHLITISSNGNEDSERWVDIVFENGVFYFNKNKQYSNVQYVGIYDYNNDEIHWYKNMQDRKKDINMIFKWVQHKKFVLIPKPVPQQSLQKSLKNNLKQSNFDGTSFDEFPALNINIKKNNSNTTSNISNKTNIELIDTPLSLNIHNEQLLLEPTLDDIPIPFGLNLFDMIFNDPGPPPGLEQVFNNDMNFNDPGPPLELEQVFNNDINILAPPPPSYLPPPPPSHESTNNTFNYIPKNSVWR